MTRKTPGTPGASLLDKLLALLVLLHLPFLLPVRLLFAPGGAGLGVSTGCEELLAADLADLLPVTATHLDFTLADDFGSPTEGF